METQIKSKAFEQLSEATQTLLNPVLQSWKDQGGKIVGHFCSTVPVELITAAGIVPFRMGATGSASPEEEVEEGRDTVEWNERPRCAHPEIGERSGVPLDG